jgi:hypothetical protein
MTHDEMDRIFMQEEDIIPSSGFTASVMESVIHEASTPPIPFPWLRALPGLILAGLMLLFILVQGIIQLIRGFSAPTGVSISQLLLPLNWLSMFVRNHAGVEALWIAAALILTLASFALSARLTSSRS